tara:strand:- start:27092 stop:29662 length:2571 start_codon:yes stop_codon:yes gene_type:complete
MVKFLLILCLLISAKILLSQTVQSIDYNWQFKELNEHSWLPAKVPGTIHTDLMDNGIIEDPYYRLNERKVQWVDKKDWVYQTTFNLDEETFNRENHELCFEGLDTYTTVYLNDSVILRSNNMHRTYTVNVNPYLREGDNILRVLLESPIRKGLALYDSLGYVLPVSANDQAETGEVPGGKRINVHTRKAAYHYGWDWGPRLVTSGIWRPITLRSWDEFRINELSLTQKMNGDVAVVMAHIKIESSIEEAHGLLEVYLNNQIIFESKQRLVKGLQQVNIPIKIDRPELWWPKGMGKQNLYDIKVSLKRKENRSSVNHSIGIRKIKLIADSTLAQPNFYFKVNETPVFAKGVNYIPQDIFLPRVKSSDYEMILGAAADANMNMIRVWGGGIYEDDRFYELCDSLGLMVWQDFMFACAMYPGDDAFLENVRQEAINNVKRLSKHPSIALWCGNNEVLAAWKRWGWEQNVNKEQSPEVSQKIWQSYDTLFHTILPSVVNQYHKEIDYWASSPSASEGLPEEYTHGDTHYWGVWWGKEPFSSYNAKISSFMSEYGFQSFPEYSSFHKFAEGQDRAMHSEVMKSHQRSSIGNETIEEYLDRSFRKPIGFEELLYMSQLLQADGIQTAIEAHRRNKDRCMGSLYWQLNDCWPGASWSSIDYYGKWKALHYKVKESFAPVILSYEFIEDNLQINVVSDLANSYQGELTVILSEFKDIEKIISWNQKVDIAPNGSKVVLTIPKDGLPNAENQRYTYLQLALRDEKGIRASKNIYFKHFKELVLPRPNLSFKVECDKSNVLYLTVESDHFARGVHVTCDSKYNFSENFFDMPINGKKTISIQLDPLSDIDAIISSIQIRSLWNSMR